MFPWVRKINLPKIPSAFDLRQRSCERGWRWGDLPAHLDQPERGNQVSVGLTAFVVTSSWLIAAGSAWLGRRCPLVAWHDCLAPAGISLILAGRTRPDFVIGWVSWCWA